MKSLTPKQQTSVLGVLGVGLLGALLYPMLAPSTPPVLPEEKEEAPRREESLQASMVSDLITDPFYHPTMQVLTPQPPAIPTVPPPPAIPGTGPMGVQPLAPPSMEGSLPAPKYAGSYPQGPVQTVQGPAPAAGTAGAPPAPPLEIRLRGIVGGERPVAFISMDGQPAQSFRPGDPVGKKARLTAVSESSITVVSGGKSITLRTGQVETL